MDAKQVAQALKGGGRPSFSVDDAREIMNRKIIIGRMSIEALKLQVDFSNNSKKLQDITTDIANKKIKLIEQQNALFEQQLKGFDDLRQDECMNLYDDINTLDNMPEEAKVVCKTLEETERKMQDLYIRIDALAKIIPERFEVTKFTVKPKQNTNISNTCATEVASMPDDILPE